MGVVCVWRVCVLSGGGGGGEKVQNMAVVPGDKATFLVCDGSSWTNSLKLHCLAQLH